MPLQDQYGAYAFAAQSARKDAQVLAKALANGVESLTDVERSRFNKLAEGDTWLQNKRR